MARVVIIHGTFGSPQENWFPWLRHEVQGSGHTALVPTFPTPQNQSLLSWLEAFDRQVGPLTPDTFLVGHSLAAAFILCLAERTTVPLAGCFLASAFIGELGLPEFDKLNQSFAVRSFNWPEIREHAGRVHMYHSDNDPYVPLSKCYEVAKLLGVQPHVIHKGGHLNAEGGYKKFPLLWKELRSALKEFRVA